MSFDKNDNCVDCGVNCLKINEYYMVTNSCWKRARMATLGGLLCVGCLEKRLGKKLTPRNFMDCPLNWRNALIPDHASVRLLSRYYSNGTKSKWVQKGMLAIKQALDGDETVFRKLTLT